VEPAFDSWLVKGNFLFFKSSERLRVPPSLPVNRYVGGGVSFGEERPGRDAGHLPSGIYTTTATFVRSSVLHSASVLALRSDRSKSKLTEGSDSVGRIVTFVFI